LFRVAIWEWGWIRINAQGLTETQLQLSLELRKDISYCWVFISGAAVVQGPGGKLNKSSIHLYTNSCVFVYLFYLFIYNI